MTDLPPGYRQIPKKINIAGELIDRIEERSFEERTAFIWDGGSITFAAFAERVNRLAHGLSGYGIERGMPVLVRMHNCIEFAETVQALLMMGALPVMQNSLLGEEEIKYVIEHSDAKAAVTLSELSQPLLNLGDKLPVGIICSRGNMSGCTDYENLITGATKGPYATADT
ncbi:MAG: hypothetical protein CL563_09215, partial [Alphaproteobacteria bacterium]|nr:hypothetical protein [Alphaproteobacteria bacterium]